MLVSVVFMLIALSLFYLVSDQSETFYKDFRFWLVIGATVLVTSGLLWRYYIG
jgi:uncharacterized membrane protein